MAARGGRSRCQRRLPRADAPSGWETWLSVGGSGPSPERHPKSPGRRSRLLRDAHRAWTVPRRTWSPAEDATDLVVAHVRRASRYCNPLTVAPVAPRRSWGE